MLKLILDGKSVDAAPMRGHTLSQLIQAIEQELTPERVIVSMVLDGRVLDNKSEQEQAGTNVEKLECLEISTQRVDSLARSTLETVIEFIPSLTVTVSACVECLHSGQEKSGYENLRRVIDGLQIISSAWPLIARSMSGVGQSATELIPQIGDFNNLLHRIAAAQESADTVQLCDLLEFELTAILDNWLGHAENMLGMAGKN